MTEATKGTKGSGRTALQFFINRFVPFVASVQPPADEVLARLARRLGPGGRVVLVEGPSAYGGELYVASATRLPDGR